MRRFGLLAEGEAKVSRSDDRKIWPTGSVAPPGQSPRDRDRRAKALQATGRTAVATATSIPEQRASRVHQVSPPGPVQYRPGAPPCIFSPRTCARRPILRLCTPLLPPSSVAMPRWSFALQTAGGKSSPHHADWPTGDRQDAAGNGLAGLVRASSRTGLSWCLSASVAIQRSYPPDRAGCWRKGSGTRAVRRRCSRRH